MNKKDSKCFSCAITVVLNHEEIKEDPKRITNIKPFMTKYNWKGINFPNNDWKKFAKNNSTIALNVLYAKREKKCILLMFENITQHEKQFLF